MDLAKVYGLTLKRLRTAKGISQEQLALKAGLDRTFISMLERGVRQPSLSTVFVIARQLGVPPSDFVKEIERKVRRSRWLRAGGSSE